jgi:deoxycytidylate deaminase
MASSESSAIEPFGPFEMHGFRPNRAHSDDENMMTLCMLVTRNSICAQGHMGCILVREHPGLMSSGGVGNAKESENDSSSSQYEEELCQRIIGVATNKPLYSEMDSDVHAEIGALGEAARLGNCTERCTAYIAMPPCKNCFGALVSAGCTRIVSPRPPNKTVEIAPKGKGVEMVTMDSGTIDGIKICIESLINDSNTADDVEKRKADIAAKRKARKEAAKLKKEKRRRTVEENIRIHAETNKTD